MTKSGTFGAVVAALAATDAPTKAKMVLILPIPQEGFTTPSQHRIAKWSEKTA
jgi:hypothetical protein